MLAGLWMFACLLFLILFGTNFDIANYNHPSNTITSAATSQCSASRETYDVNQVDKLNFGVFEVFIHSFLFSCTDITAAYSKDYIPAPKIEGLGNVSEFEVFLVAFCSSWLLSILFWQSLSYLALVFFR